MKNIFSAFLASIALLLPAALLAESPAMSPSRVEAAKLKEPVTILISIDGFRPDYMVRGITPNLSKLAETGAQGPMRPSFPTKTFPNHWTLVTGMTPDHNGIVGNTMEDQARPGVAFDMANTDPFWWSEAEPIWITAEEQGIRSATMFWPGSEVELSGTRPADWWPFNNKVSNDRRVNAVIDWMRRPAATRPRLITLYFDAVDSAGHSYGPGPGEALDAAISDVDASIGELVGHLEALDQPANIVIVSDHGMTETSPERVITLDAMLPRSRYRLTTDGNYAGIEPLADNRDEVISAFVRPHPHMECWERENIPAYFHYGKNPRVPSILCLPETGWLVYQEFPARISGKGGGHGYDQRAPDMMAFFLANGPGIDRDQKLPVFDNVNIYALVAHLAGITPNANDGSLDPFKPILISR